jgi:hypothetical protein
MTGKQVEKTPSDKQDVFYPLAAHNPSAAYITVYNNHNFLRCRAYCNLQGRKGRIWSLEGTPGTEL